MGYIIKIPIDQVQPSEHFLREGSIRHALEDRLSGKQEVPQFVEIDGNKYDLIDGHNRAVVDYLFGDTEITVYVARSSKDTMPEECANGWDLETIRHSNKSLAKTFLIIPGRAAHMKHDYHIFTVGDLAQDYAEGGVSPWLGEDLSYLTDLKATLNHFKLN